jgi:hypothetical protein
MVMPATASASLAPFEIRDETLKELRAMRGAMMSAPWILAMRNEPEEVRRDAALRLFEIQQAILELENTALAKFRDRLVENEAALRAGRTDLEAARQNLTQVQDVLRTVGEFLGIVARVVAFVAVPG